MDLAVLVADGAMKAVVSSLLSRPKELQTRRFTYEILVHQQRDPGCYLRAHHFLRSYSRDYAHALVVFDHEGCGRESDLSSVVAEQVKLNLSRNGWGERAEVVVISPELEVWAWTKSAEIAKFVAWRSNIPLYTWLGNQGHWPPHHEKPPRPKEALEAVFRKQRIPRTSSAYAELASTMSLFGHTEEAFARFLRSLRAWFPQTK